MGLTAHAQWVEQLTASRTRLPEGLAVSHCWAEVGAFTVGDESLVWVCPYNGQLESIHVYANVLDDNGSDGTATVELENLTGSWVNPNPFYTLTGGNGAFGGTTGWTGYPVAASTPLRARIQALTATDAQDFSVTVTIKVDP